MSVEMEDQGACDSAVVMQLPDFKNHIKGKGAK